MNETIRKFIIPLLILFTGAYAFTQAMLVPLSTGDAEKIMIADRILSGTGTVHDWHFSLLELPVWLAAVKMLGISTLTAIAVHSAFWTILFSCGVFILKDSGMLAPLPLLIWTALTALPDPVRMKAVEAAPLEILCWLLLLHFLSKILVHRDCKSIISAGVCCIPLAFSRVNIFVHKPDENAVHDTLLALRSVFCADFSKQPLLKLTTILYFLATIVLLFTLYLALQTMYQTISRRKRADLDFIYAAAMILTILFCMLPFFGDRIDKMLICSWLPFGSAILIALFFESKDVKEARIAGNRIYLRDAAGLFFVLLLLFGFGPIERSRPASDADQVIVLLNERHLTIGYCDEADRDVLTVAGKDRIQFTQDPGAQENQFFVLQSSEPKDGAVRIGPYHIIIPE